MADWTIDEAGILRTADGRPLAALEPELPEAWVTALSMAPRLISLVSSWGRYQQAKAAAERAGVPARVRADEVKAEAREAVRRTIRGIVTEFRNPLPPEASGTCACNGDCGEGHLGGRCGVQPRQKLNRLRGFPGVWNELASNPLNYHPTTQARILLVDESPRCQRCAWLTVRRRGAQGET